MAVGTPVYMSPEQSAGDEMLDGRSDQYELAAVVYETLAGAPPYTGPNARAIFAQKLTEPAPPLTDRRPDVPVALERVLLRALERARDARYETIDEFATALVDAARSPAGTPVPGTVAAQPPVRPSRAMPRGRRLAVLVAGLLLVLAAGIAWGMRRMADRAGPSGRRARGWWRCCRSRTWARRATSTSPTA